MHMSTALYLYLDPLSRPDGVSGRLLLLYMMELIVLFSVFGDRKVKTAL